MRSQLILSAILGVVLASLLTWIFGLHVHLQPFAQTVDGPASFVVAAAAGAVAGPVLRLAVRDGFGV